MATDFEIAKSVKMKHINDIAINLGIDAEQLEQYGKYKAKLPLHLIDENKLQKSNLILVTSINPTPAGEGKTTVSIGLADGLKKIGKKAILALREPSLGPVFGLKGKATGGGYSQVMPMEDINLHFTGDFGAIEKANNLLAALIDNNLQLKQGGLNLDPRTIRWKRVVDLNDRSLRKIVVGLGGVENGIVREDGFNITAASEVMAILCMATDFSDLKRRLASIYIGRTFSNQEIFAKDLKAENAMAILLKDAIKPNLVQTLEGNPAIIHGGPFANIAQGTNSLIATKMAMTLADYVITEAGFGADLGAEKFLHIKCINGNIAPKAVVIVATVRALRHHGGASKNEYNIPSLEKVQRGFLNLEKHIENCRKFGFFPVVAINSFPDDSEPEVKFIIESCNKLGVSAVTAFGFSKGGDGMTNLAEVVVKEIEKKRNQFKPIYKNDQSIKEKIEIIAKEIYGADGVDYSKQAIVDLKTIEQLGLNKFPICIAKTQKSFSDNEKLTGRPTNFRITVSEFEFARGAGFVIPLLGKMMRMPGLPDHPTSESMFISDDGKNIVF